MANGAEELKRVTLNIKVAKGILNGK